MLLSVISKVSSVMTYKWWSEFEKHLILSRCLKAWLFDSTKDFHDRRSHTERWNTTKLNFGRKKKRNRRGFFFLVILAVAIATLLFKDWVKVELSPAETGNKTSYSKHKHLLSRKETCHKRESWTGPWRSPLNSASLQLSVRAKRKPSAVAAYKWSGCFYFIKRLFSFLK